MTPEQAMDAARQVIERKGIAKLGALQKLTLTVYEDKRGALVVSLSPEVRVVV